MNVITTELPGVLIVEPKVFYDPRGFFLETYQKDKYKLQEISEEFVQDNHSKSLRGTIRGLHAQLNNPQGKLVRVIEGEIFDVAVDIRRKSQFFGKWIGVSLSSDNFRQLYIPPGFAHGFCVLSELAQVEYKCTTSYDPLSDISIKWDDPEINIKWPYCGPHLISDKDKKAPFLEQLLHRLPEV